MVNSQVFMLLQNYLRFLKTFLASRWPFLILLILGVGLPLLLFETLAIQISSQPDIFAWDISILLALHEIANPELDQVATILTKLGVVWGVGPAAGALTLRLLKFKQWRSLSYFLVALLGSAAINRSAKEMLHRLRPDLWQSVASELDYSFPSGHAMSSMTFVIALVILTWNTRWRGWVMGFGSVFVVLIGWTRLYLGVHFPSDILAGWMISVAWAIGAYLFFFPTHGFPQMSTDQKTQPDSIETELS